MGPSRSDMALQGITLDRLSDRAQLLQSVDSYRRPPIAVGRWKGSMFLISRRWDFDFVEAG